MKTQLGRFKASGYVLLVKRGWYQNNRMAIMLQTSDGVPFATLSVNLPNEPAPPEGCFWAKTWSENQPLRAPALASGLFEDTGRRTRTGFVQAELWRLKGEPNDAA
jgi:hypothetical protein